MIHPCNHYIPIATSGTLSRRQLEALTLSGRIASLPMSGNNTLAPKNLSRNGSSESSFGSLRHSDAVNLARLTLSELGAISLPSTVGTFRQLDDDRVVKVGIPGVADIIACYHGRFVAVEVKVARDIQRKTQKPFQTAIERAGGIYILARFTGRADGRETIKEALANVR